MSFRLLILLLLITSKIAITPLWYACYADRIENVTEVFEQVRFKKRRSSFTTGEDREQTNHTTDLEEIHAIFIRQLHRKFSIILRFCSIGQQPAYHIFRQLKERIFSLVSVRCPVLRI